MPDDDNTPVEANERATPTPEERVAAAEARAAEAVSRYRQLVASAPGLVPELVRGDTIEEIDASLEAARHAYEEVSRSLAHPAATPDPAPEVPTGNPARSSNIAAAISLSPEAKIALGLRATER